MWLEGGVFIGLWIIKKTRWDKGNLEAGQGFCWILEDFWRNSWGFRFFEKGDEIFW